MRARIAATAGLIGAALALLACAPREFVLLPTPPVDVRKESSPPAPQAPGPKLPETRQEPPDSPERYAEAIRRTREAIARGSWQEALPLWKALEAGPMGTDAIFHQGVLLQLAGDLDGAAARYLRVTDNAALHEPAAANLLGIYLLRGELRSARSFIDRILAAGRPSVPDMIPELSSNIAATLVELGEYDRAAELFQAIGGKGTRSPSLAWNMAVLSYKRGEIASARRLAAEIPPEISSLWPVAASRFAWERDGGRAPSLTGVPAALPAMAALAGNLSAFEEYRKGNVVEALRTLDGAREGGDRYPELLTNRGILEAEKGNWREARASLERAVEEKPGLAEGWLNLGVFREVFEGDSEGALDCYRRYVTLTTRRQDEVRTWIDWLQKSPPSQQ